MQVLLEWHRIGEKSSGNLHIFNSPPPSVRHQEEIAGELVDERKERDGCCRLYYCIILSQEEQQSLETFDGLSRLVKVTKLNPNKTNQKPYRKKQNKKNSNEVEKINRLIFSLFTRNVFYKFFLILVQWLIFIVCNYICVIKQFIVLACKNSKKFLAAIFFNR